MNDKIWKKAAKRIISAGQMPFPITDTLYELLQIIMTEEQAQFISIFTKASLSLEQIRKKTEIPDEKLHEMLDSLSYNGIVVQSQSRSTGITVYRLLGPFPGMFEYSLNRGLKGEKERKIAPLFEKLFDELSGSIQKQYDSAVKVLEKFPAISRVIPIEQSIDVPQQDIVKLRDELNEIIDNYELIGLSHCYCRIEKDILDNPCKVTDKRENCLLLGKSAKFGIDFKFARQITQQEAKNILKEAENEGLVHKIFHVHLDPTKDVEAICNCCKCCCGIFQLYYKGAMPYHTLTGHIASVNPDVCVGCEICVEKCPLEALDVVDSVALVNQDKCIGCGVCTNFCPQDAITMENTGRREVIIPPPRIAQK